MHITRKFWSPEFCRSYAPLNLKISRNLLLKQLVSATPLKLLNRISWNLVGSKDTICSCAYYQEILPWQYGIVPVSCNPCFSTFDQILLVFHGLKTVLFCYSLKLNFICYLNRFFTFDYSVWDGGETYVFAGKSKL